VAFLYSRTAQHRSARPLLNGKPVDSSFCHQLAAGARVRTACQFSGLSQVQTVLVDRTSSRFPSLTLFDPLGRLSSACRAARPIVRCRAPKIDETLAQPQSRAVSASQDNSSSTMHVLHGFLFPVVGQHNPFLPSCLALCSASSPTRSGPRFVRILLGQIRRRLHWPSPNRSCLTVSTGVAPMAARMRSASETAPLPVVLGLFINKFLAAEPAHKIHPPGASCILADRSLSTASPVRWPKKKKKKTILESPNC